MIPSRVLLLLEAGDGGAELLHGFFEQRAWGADIESHVAVAGNAVNLAVVEREVSLLGKETHQLGMVQAQSAAVEPHQERCLWLDGVDVGEVFLAVVGHVQQHFAQCISCMLRASARNSGQLSYRSRSS